MANEEVVQEWLCPKCGATYESFVVVQTVQCQKDHTARFMKLQGQPEPTRRTKPLATEERPAKKTRLSLAEQLQLASQK